MARSNNKPQRTRRKRSQNRKQTRKARAPKETASQARVADTVDGGKSAKAVGTSPPERAISSSDDQSIFRQGLAVCRRALFIVGLFSLAINLLLLTVPLYLFQVSDRVLVSGSVDTLIMLSVVAVGAILVMAILEVLRRFLLSRVSVQVEAIMGGPVLAAALQPGAGGSGQDIQGLRDLSLVRSFVSGPVLPLIFDAPLAPIYIGVVYLIHPHLGHLALAGAVLLFCMAVVNQLITAKPLARQGAASLTASAQAQGQARNAEVVQAMGMMQDCVRQWGELNAAALNAQVHASDRNALLTGVSKFIRLALQIAVLGWGAFLALSAELTAGMMIAGSIIASRALAPIEGSIDAWRSAVQARQSYKRVKAILAEASVYAERLLLPEPTGELTVEELGYRVPGQKQPILMGISFRCEPGDGVAIIGPTGAGKSTLARLLVGALLPSMGAVRLDGTDTRNWDRRQFGRHVGYLPQDIELFPGTVAENIARLQPDADPKQVVAAAKLARAHELIAKLPGGYDTVILAGGAPLSGGQRQRIGLARAFFGYPCLVVLDEPNANLDGDGQEALARALAEARKRGITVLSVTQRRSLLRSVNKVLVLRNGQLEAYGNRDDVLRYLSGGESAKPRQIKGRPVRPVRATLGEAKGE